MKQNIGSFKNKKDWKAFSQANQKRHKMKIYKTRDKRGNCKIPCNSVFQKFVKYKRSKWISRHLWATEVNTA